MGCGTSANSATQFTFPADWITVVLNMNTGDIALKGGAGETLAKFTHERKPVTSITKKLHFVEQKIGGTWDESKLGGKVKFSCLDQAAMEAAWKEVGKSAWGSDSSEVTASTATSNNSLKDQVKVGKSLHCGGMAEFNDQVFLMTGGINETVFVVERDTGEVVLTLRTSQMGRCLKFYDCLVKKTRNSLGSLAEEEQAIVDKAFCGIMDGNVRADSTNIMEFKLKPEFLEKMPISLIAMTAMYSNYDLNSVDC